MNIAICDDDPQDVKKISGLLLEHFDKNGYTGELFSFSSGEALLKAFAEDSFDAVFLDIYMNGISGMETAKRLRELDPNFALVFITSSRDHALESFPLRPHYYVTKPIKREDIDNAFARCRSTFIKNARFVEMVSDRAKIKIPVCKLLYVETFGRETVFHTMEGDFTTTAQMLLDDLERELGGSFLRCHRSFIVNMNHIKTIAQQDFRLLDGSLVPMSQRRRTALRDAYADFVSDRLFETEVRYEPVH
jgi:DNA-binding LytR/AlgR family response regulator